MCKQSELVQAGTQAGGGADHVGRLLAEAQRLRMVRGRRSPKNQGKVTKSVESLRKLFRKAVERLVGRHGQMMAAEGDPALVQQGTSVFARHRLWGGGPRLRPRRLGHQRLCR